MSEEKKIPVPAAWAASRVKEAERRELIGEWRHYLSTRQQDAVNENPHERFKSHIPIETLKNLSPAEREELMIFEEREHGRLKPVAQAEREQRQAFVRAGGDTEIFDANWETYGRDAHIAQVAGEDLDRASRATSPY